MGSAGPQTHPLLFHSKVSVDFGKVGPRPPVATGHAAKKVRRKMQMETLKWRTQGYSARTPLPGLTSTARCQKGWGGPGEQPTPLVRSIN